MPVELQRLLDEWRAPPESEWPKTHDDPRWQGGRFAVSRHVAIAVKIADARMERGTISRELYHAYRRWWHRWEEFVNEAKKVRGRQRFDVLRTQRPMPQNRAQRRSFAASVKTKGAKKANRG